MYGSARQQTSSHNAQATREYLALAVQEEQIELLKLLFSLFYREKDVAED